MVLIQTQRSQYTSSIFSWTQTESESENKQQRHEKRVKPWGGEELDHLRVDGGIDPGQSPAQVVQLLWKNLLALLQLIQDVGSLEERHTHTHTQDNHPLRFYFVITVSVCPVTCTNCSVTLVWHILCGANDSSCSNELTSVLIGAQTIIFIWAATNTKQQQPKIRTEPILSGLL